MERKSATAGSATPRSDAARTIASPSGCSLERSAAAATASNRSSVTPAAGCSPTTAGLPAVMVPVLSSTTVSTFASPSSAAPPFTRMPRRAATPVATMMAVGVASPSAHGHAMTSTAMALVNAIISASLRGLAASGNAAAPNTTHSTKVSTDAPSTITVNHALTVSASRATGARSDCASSTIRTICCSTVSAPTFEARKTIAPLVLSVPAMMASPARLATGTLSPVNID